MSLGYSNPNKRGKTYSFDSNLLYFTEQSLMRIGSVTWEKRNPFRHVFTDWTFLSPIGPHPSNPSTSVVPLLFYLLTPLPIVIVQGYSGLLKSLHYSNSNPFIFMIPHQTKYWDDHVQYIHSPYPVLTTDDFKGSYSYVNRIYPSSTFILTLPI